MKYYRVFMGLVLIVTSLLYLPITTAACSCEAPLSAKQELDQSTVVFRGEVKEIREESDFDQGKKVLFKVNEIWKGGIESEVVIRTAAYEESCGFSFRVGEEYLVYAGINEAFEDDNLMTGYCDRTSDIFMQQAQEDLEILGQGMLPGGSDEHDLLSKSVVIGLWVVLGVFILIIFLALRYGKKTDS